MLSRTSGVVWILVLCAAGCGGPRDREGLTYAELTSAPATIDGPVSNELYMPTSAAAAAKSRFSGVIVILEHRMQSDPAAIRPAELNGKKTQLFPGVELGFVSHGDYLLPVERDLIILPDSDSFWQLQVSPGRVWSEPGDRGMSRASFPFILTSIIENETYNGLATFLFDDDSVSMLRYQTVRQTSPFMVETWFVAFGQTAIERWPQRFDDARLVADFEQELADRLEWRDWSELEGRYGAALFADFDDGLKPDEVLTSGLSIDDLVYVRTMATPWGDYPYPREMRHGVWSATKTLAGLVTLARLAQKYGDDILDIRIRDLLDVTAEHDGWDDVTLRHAMSMATGIGTGSEMTEPNNISDGYVDSDKDAYMAWYLAPTLDEKLEQLFRVPRHPWGPGVVARYRDRDIFVAAAAMQSLYRRMENDEAADLWQMMLDEVYTPIGIHHMPQSRTREADGPGTPLLCWGIYVTVDDIVKIAKLLQARGEFNGTQLLSRGVLAEAFYETDVRGLPTGGESPYGTKTYHLTLWHQPYVSASGREYTAPAAQGYGSNTVQFMPNGMIGFRVGNGEGPAVEPMMLIADKIRPFDE